MKNKFTHISAAIMSGMLLFGAAATPIYADDSLTNDSAITITVGDDATREYKAYRVFKGRVAQDGTVADLQWAEGIDSAAFLTNLKADDKLKVEGVNPFADAETAQAVADVLKVQANNSDFMKEVAKIAADSKATAATDTDAALNVIATTGAGYYLVLDVTGTLPADAQHSEALLWTTQATNTVAPKLSTVSFDKQVAGDKKVADYSKGDDVPYTITFTLPANYRVYDEYKLIITDHIADGLQYNADSFTLKAGSGAAAAATPVIDGQGFTLTINDLKTAYPALADGEDIVLNYTARVRDTVALGADGNTNTANAQYSNDPNSNAMGNATPATGTKVLSYELKINKVDQNNQALNGATFTLAGGSINQTIAGAETSMFEFKGIDSGTYTLTEDVAPMGYNALDPKEVVISATYDDANGLTALSATVGGEQATCAVATGVCEISIQNVKGTVLPSAGGMGVYALYGAGLAAMAAGTVLAAKSRKKEEE